MGLTEQPRLFSFALFIVLGYCLFIIVYRLIFHPLAKFPGPRLAAITFKYEYYYDGIKKGQYTRRIGELHEKYGTP